MRINFSKIDMFGFKVGHFLEKISQKIIKLSMLK